MTGAVPAVYRASPAEPWLECEIVDYHVDGRLVLREVGRLWPGIWIADLDCVRVQDRVFEWREPFGIERMAA